MAVRTHCVASFEDKSIVLAFDWDDETGEIIRLRCTNTSPFGAYLRIEGDGGNIEWTFQPGDDPEVDTPVESRPIYDVVPGPRGPIIEGFGMAGGTFR